MSPPPCLVPSSSLFLLALILAGYIASAAAIIDVSAAARTLNRVRKIKQAREFLYAHNMARVAQGMPPLRWDVGLTKFASRWAKRRKRDCKMTHSGGPYGENMFWSRGMVWSPSRIVAHWVGEKSYYNPKTKSCVPGEMCGHYTQIVWRTTSTVGCASVKCKNETGYIAVCEYNPPGNFEGEGPFDPTIGIDPLMKR